MTPRVLIVSAAHLCRNPRVWKEASALGAAGFDVTVLTVSSHAASLPFDRELMAGAPFRLMAIDHLAPGGLPRLLALADRLRTRLARMLAVGIGLQSPSALGPALSLLAAARRRPADLTIVHCEAPAWVGLRLLRKGRRVAADFEDWYSEDLLPSDRRHRPLRLLRRCEQELLQRAAYVTTTSAALAGELHRRYGGREPEIIRNVFPLPPPPPPRTDDRPPVLVWMSQTVGPGRGLENLLRAWSMVPAPSELRLLGGISTKYQAALLSLVPAEKRASLRFEPFVSPIELPACLAQADVGLALEAVTPPSRDLTITNKFFHYLGAGLAVLATPTAGQRESLDAAPGIGWLESFDDPAAAAQRLDRVLGDRPALRAAQARARAAAETRFCWEKESSRLLEIVRTALNQ